MTGRSSRAAATKARGRMVVRFPSACLSEFEADHCPVCGGRLMMIVIEILRYS